MNYRIFIVTAFVLLVTFQHSRGQSAEFTPVKFEREHSVSVTADPKWVFDNIARPDRFRGHEGDKREFLFGSESELGGAMFRVGNLWYAVAEHNPKDLVFRYVMLMPESELLMGDYSVKPAPKGNSLLTVRWRVTGFNTQTNAAIQGYLDNNAGAFERQVEDLGKKLSEKFDSESRGRLQH